MGKERLIAAVPNHHHANPQFKSVVRNIVAALNRNDIVQTSFTSGLNLYSTETWKTHPNACPTRAGLVIPSTSSLKRQRWQSRAIQHRRCMRIMKNSSWSMRTRWTTNLQNASVRQYASGPSSGSSTSPPRSSYHTEARAVPMAPKRLIISSSRRRRSLEAQDSMAYRIREATISRRRETMHDKMKARQNRPKPVAPVRKPQNQDHDIQQRQQLQQQQQLRAANLRAREKDRARREAARSLEAARARRTDAERQRDLSIEEKAEAVRIRRMQRDKEILAFKLRVAHKQAESERQRFGALDQHARISDDKRVQEQDAWNAQIKALELLDREEHAHDVFLASTQTYLGFRDAVFDATRAHMKIVMSDFKNVMDHYDRKSRLWNKISRGLLERSRAGEKIEFLLSTRIPEWDQTVGVIIDIHRYNYVHTTTVAAFENCVKQTSRLYNYERDFWRWHLEKAERLRDDAYKAGHKWRIIMWLKFLMRGSKDEPARLDAPAQLLWRSNLLSMLWHPHHSLERIGSELLKLAEWSPLHPRDADVDWGRDFGDQRGKILVGAKDPQYLAIVQKMKRVNDAAKSTFLHGNFMELLFLTKLSHGSLKEKEFFRQTIFEKRYYVQTKERMKDVTMILSSLQTSSGRLARQIQSIQTRVDRFLDIVFNEYMTAARAVSDILYDIAARKERAGALDHEAQALHSFVRAELAIARKKPPIKIQLVTAPVVARKSLATSVPQVLEKPAHEKELTIQTKIRFGRRQRPIHRSELKRPQIVTNVRASKRRIRNRRSRSVATSKEDQRTEKSKVRRVAVPSEYHIEEAFHHSSAPDSLVRRVLSEETSAKPVSLPMSSPVRQSALAQASASLGRRGEQPLKVNLAPMTKSVSATNIIGRFAPTRSNQASCKVHREFPGIQEFDETTVQTYTWLDEEQEHEEIGESLPSLKFQIPEEDMKKAMLASKSTMAAYWSHGLYRGPANEQVLVHYCRSVSSGEKVAKLFLNQQVLGFDIEWKPHSRSTSGAKSNVSLVQLACEDRIALFHLALHQGDTPEDILPPTLRLILESTSIIKSGVAIKADCSRLEKYMGVKATGLVELSRLHNLVTASRPDSEAVPRSLVGLARQTQEHLKLPLLKGKVRYSDWSKTLNYEQCLYAAADAYAGFRIYYALEAKRLAMIPTPRRPAFVELDSPTKPSIKRILQSPPLEQI